MESNEEFNIKIYGMKTTPEERDKLQTTISRTPNFTISAEEIVNIMGCRDVVESLDEYNIPCEIRIEGDLEEKGTKNQSYDPYAQVNFYIREADYKYFKTVLMSEFEAKQEKLKEIRHTNTNTNKQNNKKAKSTVTTSTGATLNTEKLKELIVTLFFAIVGIIMIIVGIRSIIKQAFNSGIILIILGLFFFYYTIKFRKNGIGNVQEEKSKKRRKK